MHFSQNQELDLIIVILSQGRYLFLCPSPATAPEDVIPKVEPRLRGFKLKEILFSNVQINKIKLRIKLIYNQSCGKSYTTINVTGWYNMKAVGKIKQSLKN